MPKSGEANLVFRLFKFLTRISVGSVTLEKGGFLPEAALRFFRSRLRNHAAKPQRARPTGYICHVGSSRSGVFWAIIKDEDRELYFAYGPNFTTYPNIPRVGQQVRFIRLPPLPSSKFPRASEVSVQRAQHNSSRIAQVVRPDLPGTE